MNSSNIQEKYMKRCIDLAGNAIGNTYPNPMVGAVIVHNGKIIGEGYHQESGKPHAEVNAIEAVKDKNLLQESTLYVNLEPCSHHGKTPPCSELIVETGIPRVIIGTRDTSGKVSGKGIEILKKGGCEVKEGVLEKECREVNKRFFTFHEKKRPYIILKWAQTMDGFIDKIRKQDDPIQPNWITNQISKKAVHKWRAEEEAILVGSVTTLKDNPQLNVREWAGKDPLRLVLDKNFDINDTYKLINDQLETIIFTDKAIKTPNFKNKNDNNTEIIQLDFSENLIEQILHYLYENEISSVFVEGGAYTIEAFISQSLWDEARIFVGNKFFYEGIKAPAFPKINTKNFNFEETRLYLSRKN
ncbi:MAG: bifunctional diaminohydroxyphosphoribosylaminopyrimidine deaminase/5-amino-6-(5-phosphoribosylamino)uracil reductase RibD [Bacteroidota bacterium]